LGIKNPPMHKMSAATWFCQLNDVYRAKGGLGVRGTPPYMKNINV